MLRAPSTSSGNANSSECWSPLMSGSANADGTSKMLSCQNMFMAKGKLVLAPNLSNNRCSCCGSQPDEYRLPVASIRNCDSLSAPPTPATTEKFNKRAQDKQPSSEVIELVEEWGRGENQMAKEVFAEHHSSREPVHVLRDWIWNLRRTVYFGTLIPTIFKGLTTEGIQQCFWRGFVCVRGFDRVTRAPKPLYARLHFPASKTTKNHRT